MPVPDHSRSIYLDYHATTPVDPRVAEVVLYHMTVAFGNPSSVDHVYGDEAEAAVTSASEEVARLVGAPAADVVFTSGATESINLALHGLAQAFPRDRRMRLVVSPTEHSAVLDTCQVLARAGRADVRFVAVDRSGHISLDQLEVFCREGADLVCVMAANNEVGTLAPVSEVAAIAARHGALYLCDATQACGRIPLDVGRDGIAFLAMSGHKMHGPKGVGALVSSARGALSPMIHGGAQQRGVRAGTLNVPGIAGLGAACHLRREEMLCDEPRIAALRDRLETALRDRIPSTVVNGDPDARLAGNLHVSFPDCPNGAIIARVRDRLAIATGSACSSGIEAPSHVLRALGLPQDVLDGALRIGLGKWTTEEEVEMAAEILAAAWDSVRTRLVHV